GPAPWRRSADTGSSRTCWPSRYTASLQASGSRPCTPVQRPAARTAPTPRGNTETWVGSRSMGVFPPSMPPFPRTGSLRLASPAPLVAAVAGTTLWLGGAPPGAAVLAAILSATALGLLVASDSGHLVVPPLALVPLAVAGLCALQLVPLPPALLAF